MVGVKRYALFLRSRCAYAYDDDFRPIRDVHPYCPNGSLGWFAVQTRVPEFCKDVFLRSGTLLDVEYEAEPCDRQSAPVS